MDLVVATRNRGKFREIKEILSPLELNLYSLADFPDIADVAETGKTFEENAIIKATCVAKSTGLPAIGDDSGLEVDFLNGQPGVYSARFAGNDASDSANNAKLLSLMEHVHIDQRQARFVCCIALAVPDELIGTVRGTCEGVIAQYPRGDGGFGYDPLFIARDYNMTFAELTHDIKNKISHRAKALNKTLILLEKFLLNGYLQKKSSKDKPTITTGGVHESC
ncbi:MAG: XTP/dITP diphosphatase [Candidatus Auribacterota bacterium]|jgi:XTP/dITP diphosphohydrolase|nr:XTP/dITP diphosphatase [Candidatus Auribacterota bacterium]